MHLIPSLCHVALATVLSSSAEEQFYYTSRLSSVHVSQDSMSKTGAQAIRLRPHMSDKCLGLSSFKN